MCRVQGYLQAVAVLALLAHHVKHIVDQLGTLCVVTLGPVVAGARLAEHKVVRTEELPVGARAHRLHGAWLQIKQDGAWHILSSRRARHSCKERDVMSHHSPCGQKRNSQNEMLTRCLVVVDADALQLQIAVAYVDAIAVNAMLLRYDLPELQRNMKRKRRETFSH